MAIAIVVWKSMRQDQSFGRNGHRLMPWNVKAGEMALDMARRAGCLKEFMRWMTHLPVMEIVVTNVEPWPKKTGSPVKPGKKSRKQSAAETLRGRSPEQKKKRRYKPKAVSGLPGPPPT